MTPRHLLVHPAHGPRVLHGGLPATTTHRMFLALERPLPTDPQQRDFLVRSLLTQPVRLSTFESLALAGRQGAAARRYDALAWQRFACSTALDSAARDPHRPDSMRDTQARIEAQCTTSQRIANFLLRPDNHATPPPFPAIYRDLLWWRLGAEVALACGQADRAQHWLSSCYTALHLYRRPEILRDHAPHDQYKIAVVAMHINERLGDLELDRLFSTFGESRHVGILGSIRGHYEQAIEPFTQLTQLHTGIRHPAMARMVRGFLDMASDVPKKFAQAEQAVAANRARLIPPTTPPAAPSA